MQQNITSYRIVRRAGYQGTRPSVVHQAGVEKLATGKERSSQPPNLSNGARKLTDKSNRPKQRSQKNFFRWKAGQINVQSGSDDFRLDSILDQCRKANLDVVCMQEVRRLGNDSVSHLGYDFFWTGTKVKRIHGVGIAIRKSPNIIVDNIIHHSARLMAADIVVCGCKIRFISAYAPTEANALSGKEDFYRELKKLCVTENNRKLCINGDFNATTTTAERHSSFDGRNTTPYENDISNNNGELLLDFCYSKNLSILNTWFDHPMKHRITWHSPDKITKKIIDYCISDSWLRQFVTDVRVYNSYFDSDHRLLITKFITPANKAARFHVRKPKRRLRYNLHSLNESNVKENFCDALKSRITSCEINQESINETHASIISSLTDARNTIPKLSNKKIVYPWDNNSELKNLILERDQQKRSKNGRNRAQLLTKKIRKLVNSLRNVHLASIGSKINEAKQNRACVEMWRKAKEHDKIIKSKPKQMKCTGLKEHFMTHFNPDHTSLEVPSEIEHTPEYIQTLQQFSLSINNSEPSADEIASAIKKLKSNKCSLDIEGEVLKLASTVPEFNDIFTNFLIKMWNEKDVPEQWEISRITALWKQKGSPQDPQMYRGISIGSIVVKVVMNIILARLSPFYESQLLTTQFGFRSGKGCNDGIYACKQLQEIAYRSNRKLYTCYVDLSSAYDHINRNFLFSTIRNRIPQSEHTDCIDLIEQLYKSTKSYMANGDPASETFSTSSGVRQGGNESPNLFNLYLDYALRVYKKRCDEAGLEHLNTPYLIPNESTNRQQRAKHSARGHCVDDEGGYADDLGIHAWSQTDIDQKMHILCTVFEEFGLEINLKKTETMIWNWNEKIDGPYPENILTLKNVKLNNVKHFKYLGVWNSFDDCHIGEKELNYRINCAKSAFAQHRKMLQNRNIHLATRVMFLNSLVRSRLSYGCHAWRPTKTEMSKLSSTYNYFLRSIIYNGFKRVHPPNNDEPVNLELIDWRYKISNEQLHLLTKNISLEEYYQLQQQKWIAHVSRRENNDIIKILTFHTTKTSKIGRPIPSILERVIELSRLDKSQFLKDCFNKKIR